MATFALVENGTDRIIKTVTDKRFHKGTPPVFRGDKPFRWLPVLMVPEPKSDATHHSPEVAMRVEANQVVRDWVAPVAKTASEIDVEKRAQLPSRRSLRYKYWLDTTNQIRKNNGQKALSHKEFTEYLAELL